MSSVNKAILIGNLGRDPEIRSTQAGGKIANFSIATSEKWKNKQTGQQEERTEWHRIVIFGTLAEIVEKYVTKGMKVYVEGKIVTRKWEDKDGTDRYTTEINADTMTMLSGGKEDAGEPRKSPVSVTKAKAPVADAPFDDEIPF